MEKQQAAQQRKGFFSRTRNIYLLAVGVAALLIVIFVLVYLYLSGAFKPAPRVTVHANNSYTETLRVVADRDYAPFSYIDETGEYAGLDVELINEIANRLQMNLDLELLDWSVANERFFNGEADAILDMETDLAASDARMIATLPTTEKQYVVYGRETITAIQELYGRRVASLHQLPELGLDQEITYMDSYAAIFKALKNGEYDFAICPIQVGNVFLEQLDIRNVQPSYAVSYVYGAIALSSDNAALGDRINAVISDMQREGWLDDLDSKWISQRYQNMSLSAMVRSHPGVGVSFLLVALLAAFLLLFLLLQHRVALNKDAYTKQLQEAKDRTEASNQSKFILLSDMLHDIQEPLNTIIGCTTLAKRRGTGEAEMREYLDKISSTSQRLPALIDDVLEMSRIEKQ